ncbi:MAG: EAL domain-containing protein [Acidobacteriota bacterium]|nr:EAL domain-containing protein [Acidobacteriota bacterium]
MISRRHTRWAGAGEAKVKTVAAVVVVAGAIRLATGVDPALAAGLVAALAAGATAYGLWTHRRSQRGAWLVSWAFMGTGLLCVASGPVLLATDAHAFTTQAILTLAGDLLAITGLCLLIRLRMAGRSFEVLSTAVVAVVTVSFCLLSLVVVPAHGWHPARQLLAVGVPACDFVMVWLTGSLMSMTERCPAGYRYLLGGFACLFFSHSISATLYLAGRGLEPQTLDAVALWGACLWGCAALHRSQRTPFEPVPLRSGRPSWPHVVLLVTAPMVAPAIYGVETLTGRPVNQAMFLAGSALIPAVVVAYLVQQVFARSAAEYRAQHDALTGVCNRVLFNDSLAASIQDAGRAGGGFAVMFLDLDRFKSINDSLGHAVGNQLLQAVVTRLHSCLRPSDTLARMGGDEFTVLVPDIGDKTQAAHLGDRVLGAFSEPFNVGGRLLPVQASIGVAVHPEDGDSVDDLLKHADTAMYQAKAAGRNTCVVYDTAMSARARLRFALESSLRSTLDTERLEVHYQPKLRAADGAMVGVEALARWRHPRLGMIPPWAFIPLAEETSLIASIGEWVLETACLQARQWQERLDRPVTVAVNLSPRQFIRQSVVGMVADVLARTGFDPTLLELEVTESVLMEHMDEAAVALSELRAMGIRCSIDDFGTGYSALTYLTDIPVDAIKIDPSFVRRIDSQSEAAPIVGAVIALAHSLGLDVVAEGVETDAQYEFLRAHACDYVQGFRFSPALPAHEIEEIVRRGLPLASVEIEEWLRVARPPDSSVVPADRLASILTGVARENGWSTEPDGSDVEAILAALLAGAGSPFSDGRHLGPLPSRMAVGTLLGLASVTGGLSAAGVIPQATQAMAAEVLAQATGVGTGAPAPAEPVVASGDSACRRSGAARRRLVAGPPLRPAAGPGLPPSPRRRVAGGRTAGSRPAGRQGRGSA